MRGRRHFAIQSQSGVALRGDGMVCHAIRVGLGMAGDENRASQVVERMEEINDEVRKRRVISRIFVRFLDSSTATE